VRTFYADQFVLPLPAGHRFPMAKYQMLRDRLAAELPAVRLGPALRATDGELALAHSPAYVNAISSGSIHPAAMREIGFPWSPAMAETGLGADGNAIPRGRSHPAAMRESGFPGRPARAARPVDRSAPPSPLPAPRWASGRMGRACRPRASPRTSPGARTTRASTRAVVSVCSTTFASRPA